MNSKQSKECPNCHRWISCTKGGFMKHAQKCLPKPDVSVSSVNKYIQSVNPLLSLTDDKIHQTSTIVPTVICMTTFLLSTEVTSAMEMTVTSSMGMTVV